MKPLLQTLLPATGNPRRVTPLAPRALRAKTVVAFVYEDSHMLCPCGTKAADVFRTVLAFPDNKTGSSLRRETLLQDCPSFFD